MITLKELSKDNIHGVLALEVGDDQRAVYPRSNAYSIAEGHYPPDEDAVWMRAICERERPIGFMMTSEAPARGEYFLWRMMIDVHHQKRGHGRRAMELLIQRTKECGNAKILLLSHLKANTNAGHFYEKLGFAYTGDQLGEDDLVMSFSFDPGTD